MENLVSYIQTAKDNVKYTVLDSNAVQLSYFNEKYTELLNKITALETRVATLEFNEEENQGGNSSNNSNNTAVTEGE